MTATSRLAHFLRGPLARAWPSSACAATRVASPSFPPAFAHGAASSRGLAAFALAHRRHRHRHDRHDRRRVLRRARRLHVRPRRARRRAPSRRARVHRPAAVRGAIRPHRQVDRRAKRVSAAEAGGYSLVIAAGLAIALGAMWYSFKELLFEPKEQSVFAAALSRVETDPRVVVRVGAPMTPYGKEGRSRSPPGVSWRTRHTWTDSGANTCECRARCAAPQGKGTVHADAYKSDGGAWEFAYLVVDVGRDRVVVVQPQAPPSIMRQAAA